MSNKTYKEIIQLVADIRSEQKVTSLDQEVYFYIAEELSGYNGEHYMHADVNFSTDLEYLKGLYSKEYGTSFEIYKKEIPYLALINTVLYYEDDAISYLSTCGEGLVYSESPDYNSVEDAIIVVWSWDRYPGYCRNFGSIRRGYSGETEFDLITGNEDSTYKTNYNVLAYASELEGMSDEEVVEFVIDKLDEDHWKWNYFKNRPWGAAKIADELGLNITVEEEEF